MPVVLEIKRKVAIIRIDNPATLNALSDSILYEIERHILSINANNNIKIAIITGSGKSFVAGADISSMKMMSVNEANEFALLGSRIFREIETSNKVFIAAVNGYALGGGCELSLACDIRIASNKAIFGFPEVSLGIFPGFSGIRRMMKIVGEGYTKELVFSGKMISSEKAKEIGLVNKVVGAEVLEEECMKLAENITMNSSNAICKAKQAMRIISDIDDENLIEVHSTLFAECFNHPDQREGMTAFLEERKPVFE